MTQESTTHIARAIDLGFGYVKVSRSMISPSYQISSAAFPSFAAPANANADIGDGAMSRLDVINVDVDGIRYTVGTDVLAAAPGRAARTTSELFFESQQYRALYAGGLAHTDLPAGATTIHVVGMGLPLTVWQNVALRASLKKDLVGHFTVPVLGPQSAPGRSRTISVERVEIWPQVLGSLVSISAADGTLETLAGQDNLVIDVGFGTMLWMATAGLRPQVSRSGGTSGGASSMLKAIVKTIDSTLCNDPRILDRVDISMRMGAPLMIGETSIDLARCRAVAEAQASVHLQELFENIGSHKNFDNIFLTGGGAHFYGPLLKRYFKGRAIRVPQGEPRFANLLGFQHMAEQVLNRIGA